MISDIIKKASKRLVFFSAAQRDQKLPGRIWPLFHCLYVRSVLTYTPQRCFRTLEFDRVFLKSEVSFTFISSKFFNLLYTENGEFRLFLYSFKVQKKHRYGRVNTNRYVSANCNIYFCSFRSLLPPLFDKHSGCYGNGLIDVAEKPKILKRFYNIRNRCKNTWST